MNNPAIIRRDQRGEAALRVGENDSALEEKCGAIHAEPAESVQQAHPASAGLNPATTAEPPPETQAEYIARRRAQVERNLARNLSLTCGTTQEGYDEYDAEMAEIDEEEGA